MSAEELPRLPATLKVLVVDNDPKISNIHRRLLKAWGCQPIVAEGIGQALIDDAKQKAQLEHCQLALVDLRLRDDVDPRDISGAELVRQLAPTLSIVVSGRHDWLAAEIARKYGAVKYIAKDAPPEDLYTLIADIVHEHNLCTDRTRIVWIDGNDVPVNITAKLSSDRESLGFLTDEPYDLIGRVFPNKNVSLVMINNPDTTHHESVLQRSSFVFQALIEDQPAEMVAKISSSNKIEREVNNYRKHVKLGTRSLFRANLEDYKILWSMGIVVYSLIGSYQSNDSSDFTTISQFYKKKKSKEIDEIMRPIRHLFSEQNWGHWYNHKIEYAKSGQNLLKLYDESWGGVIQASISKWHDEVSTLSFETVGDGFPNPTHWITQNMQRVHIINDLRLAVTHGDLHANNIFVSEFHALAIDFERTGYGPILRDFVELVQDILTRLIPVNDSDVRLFYELIIGLCLPTSPTETAQSTDLIVAHDDWFKAFLFVRDLQQIAYQLTRYHDQREFLWGLLLNNLFVLARAEMHPRRQMLTRLFASILCHRLEHWGRTWPPKGWPPVTFSASTPKKPGRPKGNGTSRRMSVSPSTNTHTEPFRQGYALLIGVGKTPRHPSYSLPVTTNDVVGLWDVLSNPQVCAYPHEQIRLLCDDIPGRSDVHPFSVPNAQAIRDSLEWLAKAVQREPNATAIIYYSGHGNLFGKEYALIPADINVQNVWDSALMASEFMRLLREVKAARLLVLFDTCYAGGISESKSKSVPQTIPIPVDDLFEQLIQPGADKGDRDQLTRMKGQAIISSCLQDQQSFYRRDGSMSIFTEHLLEALRGAGVAPHIQDIRVSNLIDHLGRKVQESAFAEWSRAQNPYHRYVGEDFSIAVLRTLRQ